MDFFWNSRQIAFVQGDQQMSYQEFEQFFQRIASILSEKGIKEESQVFLWMDNSLSLVGIFFALFYLKAIAIPLNRYLPKQEVTKYKEEGFLISDEAFEGETFIDLKDLITDQKTVSLSSQKSHFDFHRLACCVFTSGSTSKPKMACHCLESLYLNALGSNQNLPVESQDRWLLSLPLYHVGGIGIVMRCLIAGATCVIPPQEKTSLEGLLERFSITHLSVVTTQLKRLLEYPGKNTLKAVLLGGSAFPELLLKEGWNKEMPLYRSYGLTEMGSQVTTTRWHERHDWQALLTSGHPLPYREVKIASDGEILVRGKTLFKGYWGQAFSQDWLRTKDLGFFDANKRLHVIGRKDSLFISGGENIQPEEIESFLYQIEGIAEAIVIPKPDEEFGFRPVALIKSDVPVLLDTLQGHLKESLPKYKIPIAIYSFEGGNGRKVNRQALVEKYFPKREV